MTDSSLVILQSELLLMIKMTKYGFECFEAFSFNTMTPIILAVSILWLIQMHENLCLSYFFVLELLMDFYLEKKKENLKN